MSPLALIAQLVPPDLSPGYLAALAGPVAETVGLAFGAMFLAFCPSLPLGLAAALARMREILGGDEDEMRTLVAGYLDDSERLLRRLGDAVRSGDLAETARMAHRVRSATLYFGPGQEVDAATRLERLARAGGCKDEEIRPLHEEIATSLGDLQARLRDYLAGIPVS